MLKKKNPLQISDLQWICGTQTRAFFFIPTSAVPMKRATDC